MSTGGKKELMTRATAKETRDRIEAKHAKAGGSLTGAHVNRNGFLVMPFHPLGQR